MEVYRMNKTPRDMLLDGWCFDCEADCTKCILDGECAGFASLKTKPVANITTLSKDLLSAKARVFVKFAYELSTLSKCNEGKVAAILIANDCSQVFSIGINGGPSGQADCLCGAKYGCVHAEQNCLAKNTDKFTPKIMICTKQCCQTCASLIINSDANIKEFWFIDTYKDNTGLQILDKAGIKLVRII